MYINQYFHLACSVINIKNKHKNPLVLAGLGRGGFYYLGTSTLSKSKAVVITTTPKAKPMAAPPTKAAIRFQPMYMLTEEALLLL